MFKLRLLLRLVYQQKGCPKSGNSSAGLINIHETGLVGLREDHQAISIKTMDSLTLSQSSLAVRECAVTMCSGVNIF